MYIKQKNKIIIKIIYTFILKPLLMLQITVITESTKCARNESRIKN